MENNIGLGWIGEECARVISEEGYDADHDDNHSVKQLVNAAVCYALELDVENESEDAEIFDRIFPFERSCYKLKDRKRNYIVAGQFIVAALNKIAREEGKGIPEIQSARAMTHRLAVGVDKDSGELYSLVFREASDEVYLDDFYDVMNVNESRYIITNIGNVLCVKRTTETNYDFYLIKNTSSAFRKSEDCESNLIEYSIYSDTMQDGLLIVDETDYDLIKTLDFEKFIQMMNYTRENEYNLDRETDALLFYTLKNMKVKYGE